MRKFRQYLATTLIVALTGSTMSMTAAADPVGGGVKEAGTWKPV